MHQDLYGVLGVPSTASQAEITHAYRELVRRHHPDARLDEPAASSTSLEQVVDAYAVLRDPDRRAEYDRWRGGARSAVTPIRPPRPSSAEQPWIRVGPVRYHGRRP